MAKKNFLLLSLEESRAKKVATVVSNDSCRKILDYLTEKDATESELAKKLKIPLSTVHYNMQQLMETGLVNADEYHYSPKGRNVYHYSLANKYIIITPKKVTGIREKLKSILPVFLIIAGTSFIIQYTSQFFYQTATKNQFAARTAVTQGAAESAIAEPTAAAPLAERVVQESAGTTLEIAAAEAPVQAIGVTAQQMPALLQYVGLWFFIGALFALLVFYLISTIRNKQ